ncbi:MAG: response regulator transcription factor [Acidimicrobiia bacterium]|nr:response regulator transcription factor [Acidimicrobiia bacterium]
MTRVMLADDQTMVRQALAAALIERGLDVVAQVADGEATVRAAAELRPDIVVMEARLPILSGIDACRRVTHNDPHLRVLMLTNERDTSTLTGAFRAGATGYLLKSASVDDLAMSLQRVRRGETVVSKELKPALLAEARGMMSQTNGSPGTGQTQVANGSVSSSSPTTAGSVMATATANVRPISKRESEVLQLIADGCSTPEVAEQLFISQKTVKNHLASIYSKLDARDRTQAVLRAVRLGLIDLR